MRSNIDQIDHKPFVCVYDTESKNLEQIYLKVEPGNKVFDLSKSEEAKKRTKELDAFIEGLETSADLGLYYTGNVYKLIDNIKLEAGPRAIVEEVFHNVG